MERGAENRQRRKSGGIVLPAGGILIPTLSNEIRTSPRGIAAYFEHFLQLKPAGTIDAMHIRMLGPDAAVSSGLYTFHVVQDGKAMAIQARYTFVYEKKHSRWCIMEQHSSAMPEKGPSH